MVDPQPAPRERQFPCRQCGAPLQFAPGTTALACPYCGGQNAIPESREAVEELDYTAYLERLAQESPGQETLTVKCESCGAEQAFAPGVTASACAFCGSPIVATAVSKRLIKPQALLPFRITAQRAREAFHRWVAGLWFAPNALVKTAAASGLKGVYIPAWTYDSESESWYTGERGDDYYETETYQEVEDGRTVSRTRQVRKTRWSPVSGRLSKSFDDVLVLASESLPRAHAEALEPWRLAELVPYSDEYLSGFVAESYRVDLASGFERAKQIMEEAIREAIAAQIGGDHQRIQSLQTRHDNVRFKHLLLPVWLSAYRYGDKTYRFLVNAQTGEVRGERPYSWIKIAFAVAIVIAIVIVVILLSHR
jgi:hypothetical protein